MSWVPPAFLYLHIARPDHRPVSLWLPLFLLWPLLLVLGILALVATALADAFLLAIGARYHHYTILLARSYAAMADARGLSFRVRDKDTAVDVTVR